MKLKRFLLLLSICMFFLFFAVSACAAETEGIFTYTVSGGEAKITSIDWQGQNNIEIPENIGGYPVTSLGSGIMKDTTYDFGDNYVESIYIPATVKSISSSSFDYSDLCKIIVSDENTVYSSDKAGVLFSKDGKILIKAANSFDTENYTIPEGVTKIADRAFNSCLFVREVYVPDSVTQIGQQAFFQALSLEKIRLSENLDTIDQNVFARCSSLFELIVPSSVKVIENSAMTECDNLKKIVLCEGVETINGYAFESDTSLEYVFLPSTLKEIGPGAFGNCTVLTDICYAGNQVQFESVNISFGAYYEDRTNAIDTALIHTDIASETYANINFENQNGIMTVSGNGATPSMNKGGWNYWDRYKNEVTAVFVDSSIDKIGSYTFDDFSSLTTVIVKGDSLSFEKSAFDGCPLLETVILFSDGEISTGAFNNCASSIRLFTLKDTLNNVVSDDTLNVIPFSYNEGALDFDGKVSLDAYEFFDIMAVFSMFYDDIEKITFKTFSFENITLFYYSGNGPERLKVEENTLINGEIYPTVYMNGNDTPITFNTLTQGISNGSISDFSLIAKDEKHHEIVDTEIEVKKEESFIVKALRWIVTLLNKLFSLISKL